MAKSADAFRTISEVSELLDVPAHVLRFWESRFTQIKPVKRAGGRRYYRPADVALIAGLKKLLHEDGMAIRDAQKLIKSEGVRHVAALAEPEADAPPAPQHSAEKPAPEAAAHWPEAAAPEPPAPAAEFPHDPEDRAPEPAPPPAPEPPAPPAPPPQRIASATADWTQPSLFGDAFDEAPMAENVPAAPPPRAEVVSLHIPDAPARKPAAPRAAPAAPAPGNRLRALPPGLFSPAELGALSATRDRAAALLARLLPPARAPRG